MAEIFAHPRSTDPESVTVIDSNKVLQPTVVLLRPAADGPELNGIYERRYRQGAVYDWFRYDIVRIWQQPVARSTGCRAAGLAAGASSGRRARAGARCTCGDFTATGP